MRDNRREVVRYEKRARRREDEGKVMKRKRRVER